MIGFGDMVVCTYSFRDIITPRPRALALLARVTAWRRFRGPSALSAVAGRIAPTTTMGLVELMVICRKKAVSSRESVPCVTTTPATSSFANSAAML